jgi:hypothetical protein
MRLAFLLTACLIACAPSAEAARSSPPAATASTASHSSGGWCQRTTTRDSSGVVTANGVVGVLGDTSTPSGNAMTDYLIIVRRGARSADHIALRFDSVGGLAPATSVMYGVGAKVGQNPWGQFVFEAAWKPIGFPGSCWLLNVDGTSTGLVLEVRS